MEVDVGSHGGVRCVDVLGAIPSIMALDAPLDQVWPSVRLLARLTLILILTLAVYLVVTFALFLALTLTFTLALALAPTVTVLSMPR